MKRRLGGWWEETLYGRGTQQVSFGPPFTPDVIKYLLIANVGIMVLQNLVGSAAVQFGSRILEFDLLTVWFAAWPARVWTEGMFWQPFTYMFLHGGLLHLLLNMWALWLFGSPVAAAWGERRFLRFYLLSGLGAGLIITAWPGLVMLFGGSTVAWYVPTLGASGAVFAVILAYSLTWPDRTLMLLFPPIPIKAIWFIPLILGLELLSPRPGVSTVGHVGGVVVGWLLLRRMGVTGGFSLQRLKWRMKRWRMRRNLRAVRMEDEQRSRRNDRTFH